MLFSQAVVLSSHRDLSSRGTFENQVFDMASKQSNRVVVLYGLSSIKRTCKQIDFPYVVASIEEFSNEWTFIRVIQKTKAIKARVFIEFSTPEAAEMFYHQVLGSRIFFKRIHDENVAIATFKNREELLAEFGGSVQTTYPWKNPEEIVEPIAKCM
jgi:hypothetical protein